MSAPVPREGLSRSRHGSMVAVRRQALIRLASTASIVAVLSLATSLALAAADLEVGEKIEFTGVVSDAEGNPLPQVEVMLEASRSYFSLKRFSKREANIRHRKTTTDDRGEFTLDWPWDPYFNHFLIGIPARPGREELEAGVGLEFLTSVDVSRRVGGEGPVISALVVERPRSLTAGGDFADRIESEAQRETYRKMGRPEKIKTVRYPDRVETSWWYFEQGKVYRFSDGDLDKIVPFDPVRSF